ncbi:hypothetical protein [Vibrio alginolyticus]|uniref:hypothetical protein n=1 Tax=Vibrio alginolyticus TaxID=663 RepID=UPI0022AB4865|nr:hypothetical protein [Vibrio alginolyticus]MCZ2799035.1 hypothetical protein [Vibrio alginolyticus]
MSHNNDLEMKKQQFKTLKKQFEVLLSPHIEDKKTLEKVSGDCADVMLFSWHLKETGFPFGGDDTAVWRGDELNTSN